MYPRNNQKYPGNEPTQLNVPRPMSRDQGCAWGEGGDGGGWRLEVGLG